MPQNRRYSISATAARRITIHSQLLDGRTALPRGRQGVAQLLERLGYIQIDTISVIERTHHHTLWVRQPDYKHEHIDCLQSRDRRIFEYWGHAHSYLPMKDYRFFLPRMKRAREAPDSWEKEWIKRFGQYMEPVRKRIEEEGPLCSKDFEAKSETKGGWWNRKPAKGALDLLAWQGDLMITARRNFERVYDLTERVLPSDIDTSYPTPDELGRFLINRALTAYGLATLGEIIDHIRAADRDIIKTALDKMLADGEVVPVSIENLNGQDYYALPDNLDKLLKLRKTKPKLHLLSPFDNLIIQRDRIKRLFSFDYTLECYTPAAKRQFGYFVLPILYGENLVGRFDPKAERAKGVLTIKNLTLEKEFKPDGIFLKVLSDKLKNLARFNNCQKIEMVSARPAALKNNLSALLK